MSHASDEDVKLSRQDTGASAPAPGHFQGDKLEHEIAAEEARGGVTRIESLYKVFGGWKIYMLWAALGVIMYAYSLESNTTYVYLSFATSSFGEHSLLGTIQTADSIISTVCLPFIAKLADITSRPTAFLVVLAFYTVGLILIAASNTVNTVAAGQIIYTVGTNGVNLLITIILADLVSLKWRGMSYAISAAPYIINAFIAAEITDAVSLENWRWGYGMFAIIMPVAFIPVLLVLYWGDWKAKKIGALSLASSTHARRLAVEQTEEQRTWLQLAGHYCMLIDAIGLILFGTGFALVLLPFTLAYQAEGHWKNASMIAMEVVGWVVLIGFCAYEWRWAPHPLLPKRILNRTFLSCAAIDMLYMLSGYIQGEYYSSWYYVIRNDWSTKDYTYFSQCLGVGLCVFAFPAGFVMAYTHSYKWPQLFGICARIIGMALVFYGTYEHATDAVLVMSQIMIGIGGGFSVLTTQAGSQASVPHADLATAIAALSMITNLGRSIGDTAGSSIWTNHMPANLAKNILAIPGTNQTTVDEIYGSIVVAASQTGELRDAVVKSYNETAKYPMFLPGLILAILPLVFCFTSRDIYMGDNQNDIEKDKELHIKRSDAEEAEIARQAREVEEAEKAALARA